jgi:hypothetical protein
LLGPIPPRYVYFRYKSPKLGCLEEVLQNNCGYNVNFAIIYFYFIVISSCWYFSPPKMYVL